MILQALVHAYDALAASGELDKPGWLETKVSWSLELDEEGRLVQVVPVGLPDKKGKVTALAMKLPEMVKRASGIAANFLCDNAIYMLGVDSKGKKERTVKCFEACRALHERLLAGVQQPLAQAIVRFFRQWDAANAETHPVIAPILSDLKTGGNLVFSMHGIFAQDVPEIRDAWDRAYADRADAPHGRCLVTGEEGAIAVLHPSIKGVAGAQPTGASLVSFNGAAYESYGHVKAQGLNAPVGARAAFAYGAALNYMLRVRDYHTRLGDTTLVYWAEGAERAFSTSFAFIMGEADKSVDQTMLRNAVKDLRNGKTAVLDGVPMNPENPFYVLGLAPNASRLSVRFFLRDSFRHFAENLHAHQERMEIVRPSLDKMEEIPIWQMLKETANPNQKRTDEKPPDDLVGEVMRAVLMDTPYPAALYAQVQVRLRAECFRLSLRDKTGRDKTVRDKLDVNWRKAAIIKAYLLKNVVQGRDMHPIKEVLTVKLNDEATYVPYVLGRLFAVLEGLQQSANPGINTTIRDRYFNAACATPANVFPTLLKLAQNHLNKLDGGLKYYYDELLTSLCGRITESLPKHLSLEDQGVFQLGYYHQKQPMYTKKEDKSNE